MKTRKAIAFEPNGLTDKNIGVIVCTPVGQVITSSGRKTLWADVREMEEEDGMYHRQYLLIKGKEHYYFYLNSID